MTAGKLSSLLILMAVYNWSVAQRPVSKETGKFFDKDGHRMLFGGETNEHFVIDNLGLKEEQFHYGIGREKFPALLAPEFESINSAEKYWSDEDRFLVASVGDEVKAYSIRDLTRHEVVNDVVGGRPVFAAYCILADLGAVYDRTYGDTVLTFAVSGYTYFDPEVWDGLDGFILWDRDTESLWWPLIDKAVSGSLKGVRLNKLDEANWEDTSWKVLKKKYPKAKIMIPNQDYARPLQWKKIDDVSEIVRKFSR